MRPDGKENVISESAFCVILNGENDTFEPDPSVVNTLPSHELSLARTKTEIEPKSKRPSNEEENIVKSWFPNKESVWLAESQLFITISYPLEISQSAVCRILL